MQESRALAHRLFDGELGIEEYRARIEALWSRQGRLFEFDGLRERIALPLTHNPLPQGEREKQGR